MHGIRSIILLPSSGLAWVHFLCQLKNQEKKTLSRAIGHIREDLRHSRQNRQKKRKFLFCFVWKQISVFLFVSWKTQNQTKGKPISTKTEISISEYTFYIFHLEIGQQGVYLGFSPLENPMLCDTCF